MIEYFYVKDSYIEWLKKFLDSNNGFIRTYNDNYFKNITPEDDKKANELFMFFRRLLRYSKIHDIDSNVFEEEISDKYGDTYMCFDCSLVFKHEGTLINIVVLELGGASDMIVRTINNANSISSIIEQNQNNGNGDLLSAIKGLSNKLDNLSGDTYNINGITYDDGSAVQDAIKTLVRAAKIKGRV